MIGLTHTRHTQVIVEVNTPFTSLCGYLTDVNSGGVVRQPLPFPNTRTLSRHALYKAQTHTSLSSLKPTCTLTYCLPLLSSPPSTLALRIIAQCLCEGVWTLRSICGHTWGGKGK